MVRFKCITRTIDCEQYVEHRETGGSNILLGKFLRMSLGQDVH